MREMAAALMVLAMARSATTLDQSQLATPASTAAGESGVARLEDQLVAGLRVTRTDQRVFVRKVAEFVEKGAFDSARVNAVFQWARQSNPKFPFPYFERAMRFDSRRLGVVLPEVQIVARQFGRTG